MAPASDAGAALVLNEVVLRRLLESQHPDLADAELSHLADGWDNSIWRIGDEFLARLPRRDAGAALVDNEIKWLPKLAPDLPLPIPVPVRTGEPGAGYPYRWSISEWLPGDIVADADLVSPDTEAGRLGDFLAALHRQAPSELEPNAARGIPVAGRRPILDRHLAALTEMTPGERDWHETISDRFDQLASVPAWSGPPLRLHGDLHTANVLAAEGRLSAVIDWGDVCSGDPACDLAIGWMLFESGPRATFRTTSECDESTWLRAAAWALAFGVVYLTHLSLSPRMGPIGRRAIDSVLTDAELG